MSELVIYGCGGFGREVAAAARAAGTAPLAFLDDGDPRAPIGGVPVRDFAWLARLGRPVGVFVAIGNIDAHHRVVDRLEALDADLTFPTIVHPDATVGERVCCGRGAYIGAGARLTCDIELGDFVLVNVNAVVAHDAQVGERSQINPGAVVNGGVHIGREVVIGASAVLLPRISVGDRAVVGLGAVAGADVPAGATVLGNPGRILRQATS